MLASLLPCRQQTATETASPGILVVHDNLILLHAGRCFSARGLPTLSGLLTVFTALKLVSNDKHELVGRELSYMKLGVMFSETFSGVEYLLTVGAAPR